MSLYSEFTSTPSIFINVSTNKISNAKNIQKRIMHVRVCVSKNNLELVNHGALHVYVLLPALTISKVTYGVETCKV